LITKITLVNVISHYLSFAYSGQSFPGSFATRENDIPWFFYADNQSAFFQVFIEFFCQMTAIAQHNDNILLQTESLPLIFNE